VIRLLIAGLVFAGTAAATAASGRGQEPEPARIQRVRPRTLFAIAAAAAAFYFLLPKLAQVGSSWQGVLSADWAWLPLIIVLSAATYLASAVALMGAVPERLPLWPTVLTQAASSFVNRVSPANVGGMALNARYLQKCGIETSAGVAAVGVNSVVGLVVHLAMLVIFFAWAGHGLSNAFKLPSGSKLLLALAVIVAIVGLVLATRPGRRLASGKLIPGLRSAAVSLRLAVRRPGKMIMLIGGSAGDHFSRLRPGRHVRRPHHDPGDVPHRDRFRRRIRHPARHHRRAVRPGHRAQPGRRPVDVVAQQARSHTRPSTAGAWRGTRQYPDRGLTRINQWEKALVTERAGYAQQSGEPGTLT
jgi:Lysylphosphatidylglycerol synthase TM region